MRIVIFTIGTEGDVRPLIALGLGLKAAGHNVLVATDQSCAALVTDQGLAYAPLNGDFLAWMRSDHSTLKKGLGFFTIMAEARKRLKAMAEQWPRQAMEAAVGADLIIGNGMVYYLAASIGERLAIPVVETQLMPTLPSETPPPVPLPRWLSSLPGFANRALGNAARLMVWRSMRPVYNEKVRPALNLPAYPGLACFDAAFINHPRLYGFSPSLIPPSAAWPGKTLATGAWFLDSPGYEPDKALADFLAAGPPPVYIGFGSMLHHDPESFTAMVMKAIAITGDRVILATGWGGLQAATGADDRIIAIKRVPHDWLFPKLALAVHHGGAGTTSAAARAGIPSVIAPVFGDQPFWAARLAALGAAPPALPREKLSAEHLAEAIRAAKSLAMRAHAAALGEKIRAENGVATALETLSDWGLLHASPSATAAAVEPKRLLAASSRS
ncbi:glycosyltransferase [Allorhizobium undicola]|uniref:glycosyltransferase n=1 Tax=Allorhizobium undicola TaxID=78527 RepID=UPI000560906B|nr:glycosyltransferase [Allorhizobium undicola]